MPNSSVPAAATGLPVTRRRALTGLAGLAAGSVVAAPAISATAAAAEISENPELLRLGQEFAVIAAEYRDAVDAEFRIVAEWSPRWPACPEILYCGWAGHGAIERNMMGWGIPRVGPNGKRQWSPSIRTAAELQVYFESADQSYRRARTPKSRAEALCSRNKLEAKLSAAVEYERECARIHDESGYKAAKKRLREAEDRLIAHITAVLREQPITIAGVMIQARALDAANEFTVLRRGEAEAVIRNGSLRLPHDSGDAFVAMPGKATCGISIAQPSDTRDAIRAAVCARYRAETGRWP